MSLRLLSHGFSSLFLSQWRHMECYSFKFIYKISSSDLSLKLKINILLGHWHAHWIVNANSLSLTNLKINSYHTPPSLNKQRLQLHICLGQKSLCYLQLSNKEKFCASSPFKIHSVCICHDFLCFLHQEFFLWGSSDTIVGIYFSTYSGVIPSSEVKLLLLLSLGLHYLPITG